MDFKLMSRQQSVPWDVPTFGLHHHLSPVADAKHGLPDLCSRKTHCCAAKPSLYCSTVSFLGSFCSRMRRPTSDQM